MQENLYLAEQHSLEVLEVPKIAALLASKAESASGREAAQALAPATEPSIVETELAWTAEAREVLFTGSGVPSLSFPDVRPLLERIRVEGSVLEGIELFQIGLLLDVGLRAQKFFSARRAVSSLSWDCVAAYTLDDQLRRKILESMEPSGGLLDSASPALRRIRREIEKEREKARNQLTSFLEALGSPPDSFVTLRNERYMVLIHSHSRRSVKGIVHDQSSSGAGIYFEPFQCVEVNNALSRLNGDEKEESLRILRELSASVRAIAGQIQRAFGSLSKLDLVFARARMAGELGAVRPFVTDDGTLRLRSARHPLLVLQGKQKDFAVEPLDLEMGRNFRVLLVSGPNMGGKTVALKTVGLLAIMMRCGLHVTASEGTELPVFRHIFCDIGDEQSIEEQLSTFASHMRQVATALAQSDASSLVLIDELGAGTDPLEGAALAKSVLEELEKRCALSIATTHLGSLKSFVASREGMLNASMAFDPETGQPLYRLEVGLPGQSRALETALRMGVARTVIDRARASLGDEEQEIGRLLSELETLRRDVLKDKEAVEHGKRRLGELMSEFGEKISGLEREKKALKASAVREARQIVAEARVLVQTVKEELKSKEKKSRDTDALRVMIEEADSKLAQAEAEPQRTPSVEPVSVSPGIRVWSFDIGSAATVVTGPDSEGRVKVERKGITIETHISRLGQAPQEEQSARISYVSTTGEESLSSSLDLRGSSADEALESLDKYLDSALLRGLSQVVIIHGKGKGILREKVQEALSGYPFVRSFRLGGMNEGGVGVTVVELTT
ncbi:MAG: endonuclease MutS2 [Candidatus Eisenbacteria bacterium]